METDKTPRLYITDLADYNAGRLIGRWVELDDGGKYADDIKDYLETEIQSMLQRRSNETGELHEEWFFSDTENLPTVGEYTDIAKVAQIAEAVIEHGASIVGAILDSGYELSELMDGNISYQIVDDATDYAYDWYNDMGLLKNIPSDLSHRIDWEGVLRDMECNGQIHVHTLPDFTKLVIS